VSRLDKKEENYCENLRSLVVDKINNWLGSNSWNSQIEYAICIEEMEAWIHTLYENKDTSKSINAKETFQKYLSKQRKKDKKLDKSLQKLQQKPEFEVADFLSKDFRKLKNIKKALKNNQSLAIFVLAIEQLKND